jgi:hypothetical protein
MEIEWKNRSSWLRKYASRLGIKFSKIETELPFFTESGSKFRHDVRLRIREVRGVRTKIYLSMDYSTRKEYLKGFRKTLQQRALAADTANKARKVGARHAHFASAAKDEIGKKKIRRAYRVLPQVKSGAARAGGTACVAADALGAWTKAREIMKTRTGYVRYKRAVLEDAHGEYMLQYKPGLFIEDYFKVYISGEAAGREFELGFFEVLEELGKINRKYGYFDFFGNFIHGEEPITLPPTIDGKRSDEIMGPLA